MGILKIIQIYCVKEVIPIANYNTKIPLPKTDLPTQARRPRLLKSRMNGLNINFMTILGAFL